MNPQAEPRRVIPTLVINAGGQSKRMGNLKALLPIPPTQTPLITHMITRLRPIVEARVLVIANDTRITAEMQSATLPDTQITVLADAYSGKGPLVGIATALQKLSAWALMLACDLPLVNPDLCARLCRFATTRDANSQARWDAVVPVIDGRDEPLHALYHTRCLPAIEESLAQGELRVTTFLKRVRVRYVGESEMRLIDPNLHSFINVNTPDEWAAALRLLHTGAETKSTPPTTSTDSTDPIA